MIETLGTIITYLGIVVGAAASIFAIVTRAMEKEKVAFSRTTKVLIGFAVCAFVIAISAQVVKQITERQRVLADGLRARENARQEMRTKLREATRFSTLQVTATVDVTWIVGAELTTWAEQEAGKFSDQKMPGKNDYAWGEDLVVIEQDQERFPNDAYCGKILREMGIRIGLYAEGSVPKLRAGLQNAEPDMFLASLDGTRRLVRDMSCKRWILRIENAVAKKISARPDKVVGLGDLRGGAVVIHLAAPKDVVMPKSLVTMNGVLLPPYSGAHPLLTTPAGPQHAHLVMDKCKLLGARLVTEDRRFLKCRAEDFEELSFRPHQEFDMRIRAFAIRLPALDDEFQRRLDNELKVESPLGKKEGEKTASD